MCRSGHVTALSHVPHKAQLMCTLCAHHVVAGSWLVCVCRTNSFSLSPTFPPTGSSDQHPCYAPPAPRHTAAVCTDEGVQPGWRLGLLRRAHHSPVPGKGRGALSDALQPSFPPQVESIGVIQCTACMYIIICQVETQFYCNV